MICKKKIKLMMDSKMILNLKIFVIRINSYKIEEITMEYPINKGFIRSVNFPDDEEFG